MTISRVGASSGYFPNYDTETRLKTNGLMLAHAETFEKNDYRLVKVATEQNPKAFAYASDRIKRDLDLILDLLKSADASFIQHASPTFLHDDGLVLRLLQEHLEVFPFVCPALTKNQSFLKEAFYVNPKTFFLFSVELQTDLYFLTTLCTKHALYQPETIDFLEEKMDASLVKAIRDNPSSFQTLPSHIKNYPPCAKLAIESDPKNMAHLAGELGSDIEFFKYLLFSINADLYRHASLGIKKHPECAFLAISKEPKLMEFAPSEIKDNKRIALAAVSVHADAYAFISQRLKQDVEIAAHAFLADPRIYDTIPHEARTNHEFWAIALHADHSFLEAMPEECLHNAKFWEDLLSLDEDLEKLSPAKNYF